MVFIIIMSPLSCFVVLCFATIPFVNAVPVPPQFSQLNNNVVIGIMDQPIIDEEGCDLSSLGDKYLPASYVKLVESVGAKVVPIPYDAPRSVLLELFNSINALILPGGDADFTPGTLFYDNAMYLYNLTLAANDAGDYFPLIGICQGMEMLTVMMSESNCNVLDFDYSAQNISLPLDFTTEAKSSLLFGHMPSEIYNSLSKDNVTFNAHNNGLPPANYNNTNSLSDMVSVLSTNVDKNGKSFVSTYEGKKYPIWGLQFHPSRLAYEWKPYELMNHSPQAILDMQFIAYVLYDQARYNQHTFKDQKQLQDVLIYNYAPFYTAPFCSLFEQSYIWPAL